MVVYNSNILMDDEVRNNIKLQLFGRLEFMTEFIKKHEKHESHKDDVEKYKIQLEVLNVILKNAGADKYKNKLEEC